MSAPRGQRRSISRPLGQGTTGTATGIFRAEWRQRLTLIHDPVLLRMTTRSSSGTSTSRSSAAEWPKRAAVRAFFSIIAEEPELIRRQPVPLADTLDQADTRSRRMPCEDNIALARHLQSIR